VSERGPLGRTSASLADNLTSRARCREPTRG
jgi:hypothetical protein